MCHFVTGALPRGVDRALLAPILREHGLAFTPLDNPFVQAQLRADEQYVRATKASCDCGTPLGTGRARRAAAPDGAHRTRQIEELRKKRWSTAKIERWLAQQERTRKRDERVREGLDQADALYVETWRDALDALAQAAGSVGLLLHWYRGGLATERIQIARREPVRRTHLTLDFLRAIEEDVLYDVG